jgi:hypothetical protein
MEGGFFFKPQTRRNEMSMNYHEEKAVEAVPECVDLEQLDGTFEHVVFRVEHVVMIFREEGEDEFYSRKEANACFRWLKKYAPESEYAK